MSTWTISVNGVTRTPAGWGIDWNTKQFSFNSWQADVLTFAMTEADGLVDDIFAYRDVVIVYNGAVNWFVGRVTKPSATAENPKEVQKYTCKNVWADLETLTLEQARNTKVADDDFATLRAEYTSRVVIGSRVSTTGTGVEKVDNEAAITDMLDYAISEGLELQYDVDFTAMTVPYQEGNNLTVAAAMRKAVALLPDATTRWNYSTTPPTLIIRRRATETPITLDLLDSATNGLVGFSAIEADYELVPSGVEISLQSGVTNPADGLRYALINRQEFVLSGGVVTAGRLAPSPDRARMVRGTIVLAADGTYDTEAGLENLAEEIANALKELFWNCTLTFMHAEVPGTFRPGKLINFSNGQTAWATAKAIVQEVTETTAPGQTVVRCGRPPWLSKGTLDEINRLLADIRNPTNAVGTIYPGYSTNPDAPDVFGTRTFTFSLTGWTFPGTACAGSVTFTVQLLSRISCNIVCTAFEAHYVSDGISRGLAFWETFDESLAVVSPSLYTADSAGFDSKLGHPTGTFKVRFRIGGAAGAEDLAYGVPGPASALISDLVVTLNCNP